jgi:hypothetical protein
MKKETFIIIILASLMSVKLVSQNIIINELMSSNANTILDYDGETSDWAELFNSGATLQNLQGFYLSDDADELDKWEFPNIEIPAGGYLLVWASGKDVVYNNGEVHTNFKIKSSGEEIFLVNPDGTTVIDQSPAQALQADISFGHKPNNYSDWFFFAEATPGQQNTTTGFSGIALAPSFSHERGFFTSAISLVLIPDNNQDVIHYSLDGSEPTTNSPVYSAPIILNQNTPVRIKVFRDDAIPSSICTNTYFFEDSLHLGVVSLVTTHSNLWGSTGIYTYYGSGEERPVHVEYFKQDGTPAFSLDAGVKIHSPDRKPQKSFRLYARSEYGTKEINYKIFEEKEITKFKRLILRNGSNDGAKYKKTHLRDAFTHRIYQQLDPNNAIAAYLPAHVFINGNYWGIYNLRERQDEYYIKENFGYGADEIDFLEYDYAEPNHQKTVAGDWNDFNNLKDFVINNDMAVESNFQIMDDWMDMDNFIDYQIIEIFIGNQDWFNNNVKFWRPIAPGNKWKWILWDTDYGLGTYNKYPVGHPDFNFFNMAMTHGGWGAEDCTWLLRNLMENEDFNHHFVSRTLDLLNTIMLPSYTVNQFNILDNGIAPDIQKQFDKWGSDTTLWENDLEHTRDFVTRRPYFFRKHIAEELEFDTTLYNITVDVSNTDEGMVKVNTILIDGSTPGIDNSPYPWTGKYFKDTPINFKAIAKPSYEFVYWVGASSSTNPEITISLTGNAQLTAVFELVNSIEDSEFAAGHLQINIFPVPAKDNMTVKISNPERQELTLQVYNISGQHLLYKEVSGIADYQLDINVSSYKAGIYILKIIANNGWVKAKKFSVQHVILE